MSNQVPASNLILTIAANVDNEKLCDADFREFIRNSLPICAEVIAKEKENVQRQTDQDKE